jgi:hypothetical protein
MNAVLYFATTEAIAKLWKKNEELLKLRDESGVLLDTVVVVPLSEDTLLNFPE